MSILRTAAAAALSATLALHAPTAAACGGGAAPPEHVLKTPRPYSAATARQMIAAVAACDANRSCEAIAQLRVYGPRAVPQLLAALAAGANDAHVLLDLIARAKVQAAGSDVARIATRWGSSHPVSAAYQVAVGLDADGVVPDLVRQLAAAATTGEHWRVSDLIDALRPAPAKAMALLSAALEANPASADLAEAIAALAGNGDGALLDRLLRVVTDPRARLHLARRAVQDPAAVAAAIDAFDVGLRSTDPALRTLASESLPAGLVPVADRPRLLAALLADPTRPLVARDAELALRLGGADPRLVPIAFADLDSPIPVRRHRLVAWVRQHARGLAREVVPDIRARLMHAATLPDAAPKLFEQALRHLDQRVE